MAPESTIGDGVHIHGTPGEYLTHLVESARVNKTRGKSKYWNSSKRNNNS